MPLWIHTFLEHSDVDDLNSWPHHSHPDVRRNKKLIMFMDLKVWLHSIISWFWILKDFPLYLSPSLFHPRGSKVEINCNYTHPVFSSLSLLFHFYDNYDNFYFLFFKLILRHGVHEQHMQCPSVRVCVMRRRSSDGWMGGDIDLNLRVTLFWSLLGMELTLKQTHTHIYTLRGRFQSPECTHGNKGGVQTEQKHSRGSQCVFVVTLNMKDHDYDAVTTDKTQALSEWFDVCVCAVNWETEFWENLQTILWKLWI